MVGCAQRLVGFSARIGRHGQFVCPHPGLYTAHLFLPTWAIAQAFQEENTYA